MVGNIVLLQVSYYQNNWPMAKTIHVCPDKNGAVLNVSLLVGSCNGMKTVLDRPINKIVYLLRQRKVRFPTRRLGQIMMI